MKDRLLSIAQDLLACPTAPFREQAVQSHIIAFCSTHNIHFQQDTMGNIIATYGKQFPDTHIAFEAHMDHPGFIIEKNSRAGKTTALFYGGVEESYFAGTAVRVFTADGEVTGSVIRTRFYPKQRLKRVWLTLDDPVKKGDTAMWNLPACSVRGDRLYSRACDDLIGCTAILVLLSELKRRRVRKRVTAIFTVAEECGLHGAKYLCSKKKLPKSLNIFTIETSMASSNSPLGDGVVIRVGDRGQIFSPALTRFMMHAARNTVKKDPDFKYQRKLMVGGTCESSLYQAFGYRTSALCVPLGNYHNRNFKQKKIQPEFVSLSDLKNMIALFLEMVGSAGDLPNFLKQKSPTYIEEHRDLGERLFY
jgi:putative aminopeptidase FrvX